MLRIGLMGLDGHQGVVLDGMARRKDTVLAAVSSENEEAKNALRRHPAVTGQTRFYSEWEQLLAGEALDLAVICSINSLHAPMLKAAAARKLPIISEKPLALTLGDLAEVRAAVEQARVALSMLITMRYAPCYRAVHEAVRTGRIGKPVLATAFKSYRLGRRPLWQRRRATFGGTIPFVNIHTIDLLRWTTGREFVGCQAYHGNAGKPEAEEMEDHAVVLLRMDNGGVAVSQQDYLRPAAAESHGEAFLRVAGSDGVIEVLDHERQVRLTTSTEASQTLALSPEEDYLSDFLEGLEGRKAHLISRDDCFRVTEIGLKAMEAAATGRAVSL
ncbi:MAG: Gfo/Idh/MocA family oxidoreductase [Planctomycetes bacterium]|nr:Gfo/Idh/MocA family oxidoreductase [Planctomycetota bacterium]